VRGQKLEKRIEERTKEESKKVGGWRQDEERRKMDERRWTKGRKRCGVHHPSEAVFPLPSVIKAKRRLQSSINNHKS